MAPRAAIISAALHRLIALLAAALVIAGCGSSAHTPSATSPASPASESATSGAPATTTAVQAPSSVNGRLGSLPAASAATTTRSTSAPSSNTAERAYLTVVFADAQRFWRHELSAAHVAYQPARLRLFAKSVHSGCGAQEDTGPFYCPADTTIYIDLGFMSLLARHGGVGPFGLPFIVAHEFGHHVQHLLGIDRRVGALTRRHPSDDNALSTRVELQADCLAGVWADAYYARGQMDATEIDDAVKAAEIIGDDFLQRAAGQVPDESMWTHGSSRQRQHWVTTGWYAGKPGACDTFGKE